MCERFLGSPESSLGMTCYTMDVKRYAITLAGLDRTLPLVHVSRKTLLANVTFLGDIELVDRLAGILADKLKKYDVDYLVCPHVKVTPLVYGVAKLLGHTRFVVCRKNVKPYMESPVLLKPLAHFPKHVQPLVINGPDAQLLKGKKVIIIDDVISTGTTLKMVKHLMSMIDATVILSVAVIRQGEASGEPIENFLSLYELPIFTDDTV